MSMCSGDLEILLFAGTGLDSQSFEFFFDFCLFTLFLSLCCALSFCQFSLSFLSMLLLLFSSPTIYFILSVLNTKYRLIPASEVGTKRIIILKIRDSVYI
jgi:hypothetical protein